MFYSPTALAMGSLPRGGSGAASRAQVPGGSGAGSEPPVPGRFRGSVPGHGSGKVPRQGGSGAGSGHENDPVADGGVGFRDGSRTVLARFLDGMVPERIASSRRHQK